MPSLRPLSGLGLVLSLAALASCGGGGGDGLSTSPTAFRVTAGVSGGTLTLWENGATPPATPSNISLNTIIRFDFEGPVDITSLPGWAGWVQGAPLPGPTLAQGSINISSTQGGVLFPAIGTFNVLDDPSLPAGNRRRVTFNPTPPTDPANPASTGGIQGNLVYTIFVPRGGSGGNTVRISGRPLETAVLANFSTCNPTGPTGAQACFSDPIEGRPFVVSTTPSTSDPVPGAIDPSTVANDTVRVVISEPLFPANIDRSNIQLINANSGAQVPGDVVFFQAGTPEAGPSNSVIEYRASSRLLANVRYEIVFSNQVADFGSNPVALYDPNDPTAPASGRRFFETTPVPFCEATPYREEFTSTAQRDTQSGVGRWDTAAGRFVADYPITVIGDGSFGAMTFPAGASTLDTGMPASVGFAQGVWNATTFTINAGSDVRVIGSLWQAHIRCLQTASIGGTMNGSAGTNAATTVPIGSPEQGSRAGATNQGAGTMPQDVAGGVGGVGGGKGGDASLGGLMRTERGQNGFGPAVGGMLDPGPPTSLQQLTYGGGQGGDGDLGPPAVGLVGGIGGAGGSAFAAGRNGQPRTLAAQGCNPIAPPTQPISLASGIPPAFVPPIRSQSAGSGGGGGGDKHETAALGPSQDDQGGSGGGGGGGIRISAIGNITLAAGGRILADGDNGSVGSVILGGDGGGGSGGQIWLQTFSTLSIAATATLSVAGGADLVRCNNQASGAGGVGLVQLESSNPGTINTGFIGSGPQVVVVPFDFSSTIVGTGLSRWFDTGYGDPDYLGTTSGFDVGGVVCTGCSPVAIEFQGAFESLTGGAPDLATATAFVSAGAGGSLDALDGRRFFRVRYTISFDPPTVGPGGMLQGNLPTTPLPSIDFVQVRFSTPVVCPN